MPAVVAGVLVNLLETVAQIGIQPSSFVVLSSKGPRVWPTVPGKRVQRYLHKHSTAEMDSLIEFRKSGFVLSER